MRVDSVGHASGVAVHWDVGNAGLLFNKSELFRLGRVSLRLRNLIWACVIPRILDQGLYFYLDFLWFSEAWQSRPPWCSVRVVAFGFGTSGSFPQVFLVAPQIFRAADGSLELVSDRSDRGLHCSGCMCVHDAGHYAPLSRNYGCCASRSNSKCCHFGCCD